MALEDQGPCVLWHKGIEYDRPSYRCAVPALRASCAPGQGRCGFRIIVVRLSILLPTLLCACAPLTETELYELEDRLVLAREEYSRKAEFCESSGGSMSMTARTIGQPDYFDYKSARCMKRY